MIKERRNQLMHIYEQPQELSNWLMKSGGKDLSNVKVFREPACSKDGNWEYLLTTKAGKNLTNRQAQVLQKLASGNTNKAIAEHLGLSIYTVRTYVSAILRALDVSNRTQAALIARDLFR